MGRPAYTLEQLRARLAFLEKELETATDPRRKNALWAMKSVLKKRLRSPMVMAEKDPNYVSETELAQRKQKALRRLWAS